MGEVPLKENFSTMFSLVVEEEVSVTESYILGVVFGF